MEFSLRVGDMSFFVFYKFEIAIFKIVQVMAENIPFAFLHQENMSVQYIPLIPHFYIEKLGYAGVYLVFLFLFQNIDCKYSLEPPHRGGSNVYPQSMF